MPCVTIKRKSVTPRGVVLDNVNDVDSNSALRSRRASEGSRDAEEIHDDEPQTLEESHAVDQQNNEPTRTVEGFRVWAVPFLRLLIVAYWYSKCSFRFPATWYNQRHRFRCSAPTGGVIIIVIAMWQVYSTILPQSGEWPTWCDYMTRVCVTLQVLVQWWKFDCVLPKSNIYYPNGACGEVRRSCRIPWHINSNELGNNTKCKSLTLISSVTILSLHDPRCAVPGPELRSRTSRALG